MGYEILHIQYSGGRDQEGEAIANASVMVKKPDGLEVTDASVGNGPVDAVVKAIQRACELQIELVEFKVSSRTTSGSESEGEVTVTIHDKGGSYEGTAVGTDIIVASADAYMAALAKRVFAVSVAAHTV